MIGEVPRSLTVVLLGILSCLAFVSCSTDRGNGADAPSSTGTGATGTGSGGTAPGAANSGDAGAVSAGAFPGTDDTGSAISGAGGIGPATGGATGRAGGAGAAGSSGAAACIPDCEGKECGDDGCGSPCAPGCSIGQTCNAGHCDEVVYGPEGQSCSGMNGTECNGESCCASIIVPGGSFPMGRETETCSDCGNNGCPSRMRCERNEQPEHVATVSGFALDNYEVTVGRFRAFVEAGMGTQENPPAAGAGAHPLIPGSGWDSAWDSDLPTNQSELEWYISDQSIQCATHTWTSTVGKNEQYPMDCVSWYYAFAFCIWDGGRLPTEAEWEYAAAGGEENRLYPWGNDTTEPLPADYEGKHNTAFLSVGSEPFGNGRWGHSDLAGSMYEWVLDSMGSYYEAAQAGCSDCANLVHEIDSLAVTRGGGFTYAEPEELRCAYRAGQHPSFRNFDLGFRCAGSAE